MDLKKYQDHIISNTNQYITIDANGVILDSCNSILDLEKKQSLGSLYPFFDTFIELIALNKEDTFFFSCIHFTLPQNKIIVDVTLKTFIDKPALIIIQDFTSHYFAYQFAAQERNESVISKEKIELQNQFLKEQELFKSKFIANFSHELREPLEGIVAFSDFLKETELDYQQESYVNIIESSSQHLKKMLEDILDLQTIKLNHTKLQKDVINPLSFITEIQTVFKAKSQKKGLDFVSKISGVLPEFILADQIRFRQILSNLLTNAVKFTEQGTIYFETSYNYERANKYSLSFIIRDSGVGIPKHKLDTVFESFNSTDSNYQIANTKSYGLGLSIVKSLVETFNGSIQVESEEHKWTEFTVNMEFSKPNKSDILLLKTKQEQPYNQDKKIKILLVENSEITQLILLKIASKHKNIQLDINPNPEPDKFIEDLELNAYDLVLMDIDLEQQSGVDLIYRIKKHRSPDLKQTPIIVVTGKVLKEDLQAYKKAKVEAVLKKPFTEKEFLSSLTSVLGQ